MGREPQASSLAHVAQGIEQLPSKQSVAGSNPAVGTNTEHMNKKETIEDLCNKVADIKYELQQILDTLYKLESEEENE